MFNKMKNVKKFIVIGYLSVLALGIISVFSSLFSDLVAFIFIGMSILLFIILGFVIVFFWKCPNCDSSLPLTKMWDLTNCPYCGEKIKWD